MTDSYLLVWSPKQFPWDDLSTYTLRMAKGERVLLKWSIGARKSMPVGSRIFMTHISKDRKGLVASGVTTQEPIEEQHWASDKKHSTVRYVEFALDFLIDPRARQPYNPRESRIPEISTWKNWSPQGSGIVIPANVAAALEPEWNAFTHAVRESNRSQFHR